MTPGVLAPGEELRIRGSLAATGLSQPQWWILTRIEDSSRGSTRAGLVEELAPFSGRETASRTTRSSSDPSTAPSLPPPTRGSGT